MKVLALRLSDLPTRRINREFSWHVEWHCSCVNKEDHNIPWGLLKEGTVVVTFSRFRGRDQGNIYAFLTNSLAPGGEIKQSWLFRNLQKMGITYGVSGRILKVLVHSISFSNSCWGIQIFGSVWNSRTFNQNIDVASSSTSIVARFFLLKLKTDWTTRQFQQETHTRLNTK